jgi:RND family efflux transporter MFP subunit
MKIRKTYVAAAIVLLAAGGYFWYSRSQTNTAQVRYNTSVAEKGTLTTSVTGSGNVTVDQIANIDPSITGTVANLSVAVGDSVKKGQLLFTIDNDQLAVSVAQGQTSLQNAKLSISQAKNDLYKARRTAGDTERDRSILGKKISIAEQSFQATQLSYQKTLADAAKRKVVSLIDGTVNAVNIKNGDDLANISSGSSRQTPIIIGDLNTLKAYISVNEVDISNVSVGQKVVLKFDAIDGLSLTGKVEKMDSLGTISSGVVTYNVTIGFDTIDPRIKPEMSVSTSIITDVKQDVLIVPVSAVKTQGGKTYVEVLNSGTTPEQKTVEIGASNGTDTEIVSGLSVGDKVVTQTINSSTTTSTTSSQQRGGLGIPGLGGRG